MSTIEATISSANMRDRTIREARNSLTALIRDTEKGNAVRLTRYGKPVAVLMSEREFRRLSALSARKDSGRFLERWRAEWPSGLPGISDAEVDSWRDKNIDADRSELTAYRRVQDLELLDRHAKKLNAEGDESAEWAWKKD